MATAPFVVIPELTAVAVAYRNASLIADMVLPRVPVGKKEFRWQKYALADSFTLPDTKVGRKGQPALVEFGSTEVNDACLDYGLDDLVPNDDIAQAEGGQDPLALATTRLTELVALDRERRVANLVFAAGTYAAGNQQTLSGTSQFSDFTNSDPLGVILAALDACVMRPNEAVFGQAVWTKFRQHPKVVKAVLGNAGDSGVVSRQAVAELLELQAIHVGQGFLNTAKPGQTASLSRVWGKHIALLHKNPLGGPDGAITTFGFTAQFGTKVGGTAEDGSIGLRGGKRVRSGESVKECVSANDLGYFIQNAVA